MTTLQTTLDLATSVLNALANLINGAGSSTPIPDDENTPLPTYNELTNIWTINQDTADTDGIFKGIYKFALDTACSVLTIQSVSGHTTPANTSFPVARYTDCNDVTHDVTSVNDLTGVILKRFEIYSDTGFTITLTVIAKYTADFTIDEQGWSGYIANNQYDPYGIYDPGVGWGADPSGVRGQNIIEMPYTGEISQLTITLDQPLNEYLLNVGSGQFYYRIDDEPFVLEYDIGVTVHTFNIPTTSVNTRISAGIVWHRHSEGGDFKRG